jgi:hypothetical protein
MWLGYEGLTPEDVRAIEAPTLVFTGDRDEMFPLDVTVSLYRRSRTRNWPCARTPITSRPSRLRAPLRSPK